MQDAGCRMDMRFGCRKIQKTKQESIGHGSQLCVWFDGKSTFGADQPQLAKCRSVSRSAKESSRGVFLFVLFDCLVATLMDARPKGTREPHTAALTRLARC